MNCPKCGDKTYVTNSFDKKDFVVRYRRCKACKKSFKTREMRDSDWVYKKLLKQIKDDLKDVTF